MSKRFMASGGFEGDIAHARRVNEHGAAKQLVDVKRVKLDLPSVAPNTREDFKIRPAHGEVWGNLILNFQLFLNTRQDGDDRLSLGFAMQLAGTHQTFLMMDSEDGKISCFPHGLAFGNVSLPRKIEDMNALEMYQYLSLFNFSREVDINIRIDNKSDYATEPTEMRMYHTII